MMTIMVSGSFPDRIYDSMIIPIITTMPEDSRSDQSVRCRVYRSCTSASGEEFVLIGYTGSFFFLAQY
jgi:hypothetical protein